MNPSMIRALFVLTLASAAVPMAVLAVETHRSTPTLERWTAIDAPSRNVRVRRATLRQLTGLNTLSLRGTDGGAVVAFGGRADELVTKVVLRLRYSHSPALLLAQSHLRILLNDETAGIIQFTKETAARSSEQVFELDPRFIGDANRLRFQFIGHYAPDCEDQLHSSLWAEVSGASELEITARPIAVQSDLALLPEPFFDARDLTRLQLPFVFPTAPSLEMVRAGGIAASWFGQLAGWRGARFPVSTGDGVRGHAVVFATNAQRPALLSAYAPVEEPTIFERALARDADNASKWTSLAQTARFWGFLRDSEEALAAHDLERAERGAREALRLVPRSPDAMVALGRARHAMGRTTEADQQWHGALRLDPHHGGALRALLANAVQVGTVAAIDRFEAGLTATQRMVVAGGITTARTRLMRQDADRFAIAGRDVEAIALLEHATTIDQQDPWLHYDLARLYERTGTRDRALTLLDALLRRSAGNVEALHASALFLLGAGDPALALSLLMRLPENERTGNIGRLEQRARVRLHTNEASSFARAAQRDDATLGASRRY